MQNWMNTGRTTRAFAAAAAAALAALVLAACAGGSGSNKTSNTTAAGSATTSAGGSKSGDASDSSCGSHETGGVQTRTFCGNAKATVTSGGTTTSYTGGECETAANYVSVNIGTIVLDGSDAGKALKSKTAYFGLNVGRTPGDGPDTPAATADGVFTGGIAVNDHGTSHTATQIQVTLTNGRTAGQFSGNELFNGPQVTGTFTC